MGSLTACLVASQWMRRNGRVLANRNMGNQAGFSLRSVRYVGILTAMRLKRPPCRAMDSKSLAGGLCIATLSAYLQNPWQQAQHPVDAI